MSDFYEIARQVTDEVMGPGTYAASNEGNPDPRVRQQVERSRTEAEQIDPNVHIDPDDPRYNGFRMAEYWIAIAKDEGDQEAPLFVLRHEAVRFHLSEGPAMAADERRLEHLRDWCTWKADVSGQTLWIRHFVAEGTDETHDPS